MLGIFQAFNCDWLCSMFTLYDLRVLTVCENMAIFSVYWSPALTFSEKTISAFIEEGRFELFLPFAEPKLFYIKSYSCEAYKQHKPSFRIR